MVYCTECGAEVGDSFIFCNQCGAPQKARQAATTTNVDPVRNISPVPNPPTVPAQGVPLTGVRQISESATIAPVLSNDGFRNLRHPLQKRRFILALVFSLMLFPLIALGLIVGSVFLIVPLFALLFWISGRALYAHFLANSVLVSLLNYPRVYGIGEELKVLIGYNKPVHIFVYEQGNFNASLMKFIFYRKAVFLNSELLETGVSDNELRWLIGRFIGFLRAERDAGFWGWTIRAAEKLGIFNLFLLPYKRSLVYTGDRIALEVIGGDISSAVSVMQKLLVGRTLGYSVNPGGIVDQQRQVKGSFFAFLARLGSAFPHTTSRYVDLIAFGRSYYPAQYAKFEAENPGLPDDLRNLAALADLNPIAQQRTMQRLAS